MIVGSTVYSRLSVHHSGISVKEIIFPQDIKYTISKPDHPIQFLPMNIHTLSPMLEKSWKRAINRSKHIFIKDLQHFRCHDDPLLCDNIIVLMV